jgi:hypothetical protein
MDDADLGSRIVNALGAVAARELLEMLELSAEERAALIGRLYVRQDARWLADLLMDLEDHDLARWRLEAEVRSALRLGDSP